MKGGGVMNFKTSIKDIVEFCSTDGLCEHCRLYDMEKKGCVFKEIPALWDADRIKQACIEAGIAKEVE